MSKYWVTYVDFNSDFEKFLLSKIDKILDKDMFPRPIEFFEMKNKINLFHKLISFQKFPLVSASYGFTLASSKDHTDLICLEVHSFINTRDSVILKKIYSPNNIKTLSHLL